MITLQDVIDIHVHAGPELFQRVGDAAELAQAASAEGMGGIVLKSHSEPTTTAAYYVGQMVPSIQVWGGLVLNEFVGGINPSSVAAAIQGGARIIWGPTLHARHHIEQLGPRMFGTGHMTLTDSLTSSGVAWTEDGRLTPEALSVVALASEADVTIATGHAAMAETRSLAEACVGAGTRCLITHGFFLGQDVDFLAAMCGIGAMIEISASLSFPFEHYIFRNHGGGMRLEKVLELVDRIGADRVVVSSDCGQLHNASPAEGLRSFLYGLKAVGVSEDDIDTMTRKTPRVVLGISDPCRNAAG
ncbi:MAG: hypothetical protein GEU79_03240 [Acidimicrobiia bacterium]|nr:hypothetical protein [Acidimicrobiia bacterium]